MPVEPAGGGWAVVSAGSYFTCGLRWSGNLSCWGQNYAGQCTPPQGVSGWKAVSTSSGYYHTCGLALSPARAAWEAIVGPLQPTNGVWSNGTHECTAPFVNAYQGVTLRNCKLHESNTLSQMDTDTLKFGAIAEVVAPAPPATPLTAYCWGDSSYNQTRVPSDARCDGAVDPAAASVDCEPCLSVDNGLNCSLCNNGTCRRQGWIQVSAGMWHSCGVLSNGEGLCWGDNGFGQSSPGAAFPPFPPAAPGVGGGLLGAAGVGGGQWVELAAGHYHSCGVSRVGSIACWGSDMYGATLPPRLDWDASAAASAVWTSVTVGRFHSCGLTADSRARCWGDVGGGEGAADIPADLTGVAWRWLSSGLLHTCGVLTDRSGRCWGRSAYQATAVPPSFQFLST